MKTTLIVLCSGLLLSGCSQKQATSTRPAIDLVEAGQDSTWDNGAVLHVVKRDGRSLQGVRFVQKGLDGIETTVTADTGTISSGSIQNPADSNCVTITLYKGQSQSAKGHATFEELPIPLHR
jgi:hypothetical protein